MDLLSVCGNGAFDFFDAGIVSTRIRSLNVGWLTPSFCAMSTARTLYSQFANRLIASQSRACAHE
jgi:hypothetical protein